MRTGQRRAWSMLLAGVFLAGTWVATPSRPAVASDVWSAQTDPSSAPLSGVSFADALHGVAVGEGGTILGTVDGGAHWSDQSNNRSNCSAARKPPTCAMALRGVSFVKGRDGTYHGWAVGDQPAPIDGQPSTRVPPVIFRTDDGGAGWRLLTVGVPVGLADYHLNAVSFFQRSDGSYEGWVVGSPLSRPQPPPILHSLRSGTAQPLKFSNPPNDQPTLMATIGPRVDDTILTTRDGGTSWSFDCGTCPGSASELTAVSVVPASGSSPTEVWVSGAGSVVQHDDGQKWSKQDPVVQPNLTLTGVSFVDRHNGWAIGSDGTIFRTTTGGASWTSLRLPGNPALRGISAVNPSHVWVVGQVGRNALIVNSTDGEHWTYQPAATPPANTNSSRTLAAISFVDGMDGWTVGSASPPGAVDRGPSGIILAYRSRTPAISVTPTCSPFGSTGAYELAVNGAGFAPGGLTITFDGASVGHTSSDPASNSFSANLTIPRQPPGKHVVMATEDFTEPTPPPAVGLTRTPQTTPNSATATFTDPCSTPVLTIKPACSTLGSAGPYSVALDGTGFTPGPVAISFAGQRAGSAVADLAGHLNLTIAPPRQPPGTYLIHAVDVLGQPADASFLDPCPTTPVITLKSLCGPADPSGGKYSIPIDGTQFVPGPVTILFDEAPVGTATADDSGSWSATITPAQADAGNHQVQARDSRGQQATMGFQVPCPQLTVTPACGMSGGAPDRYDLTLEGSFFTPGRQLTITFDARVAHPQALPSTTSDAAGHFTMKIRPELRADGVYMIQAADVALPPGAAELKVPCFRPTLTLDPRVGPTGYVTTATGSGFPPSSRVKLAWSVGVTAGDLADVSTDGQGQFAVPVLVFPRDAVGSRRLRATPAPAATTFNPVDAVYLVVIGSGEPPNFDPSDPATGSHRVVFRH